MNKKMLRSLQNSERESRRLNALQDLSILDTPAESQLDRITQLAAQICDVPICLISLIDENRQWFKSKYGLEVCETDREISFCTHAIEQREIYEICDAKNHIKFKNNPLVTGEPHISFYAGVPLVDQSDNAIGTLCVIDSKVKKLSDSQIESLKQLANLAMEIISTRNRYDAHVTNLKNIEKLTQNTPGVLYQFQMFKDGRSCFPYASAKIFDVYEVHPHEVLQDASIVFSKLHQDDYQLVVDSITYSAQNLVPWVLEYRVNLTKGVRWLRGYAQPEKLDDESILWHGYIRDITDEKIVQEKYLQTSRLATLGEVAGGIAHEINNPLAIIQSTTEVLRQQLLRGTLTPDKINLLFDRVEKTVIRISKIISALQAFSKSKRHSPVETLELSSLVFEALNFCKNKLNSAEIALKLSMDSKIKVECRPSDLSQVVLNLILNSIEALMPLKDRWISIETKILENGFCQFRISDSGHLESEKVKSKLMQPFFTTKEVGAGAGLGLSMAKGIIEEHKGRLYLDENAANTTFVFEIPMQQEEIKVAA